jgi:hypothetical protein
VREQGSRSAGDHRGGEVVGDKLVASPCIGARPEGSPGSAVSSTVDLVADRDRLQDPVPRS